MEKLRVDVWSDIACPWCYVGKRRLEAALARFPHRAETAVVWRAFELDPSAPRERDRRQPYAERLARKYGSSVTQAGAMIDRMTGIARQEGLAFDFQRIRSGNTFDAHRVLHLAGERGVQDAVKERFLRGYMTEGEPIGDPDALARMAAEAAPETFTAGEVHDLLETDRYAHEVRADEDEARAIGISGVPFFVFGGRYAISGAQPAEALLGALEQTWREVVAPAVTIQAADGDGHADGDVCGPDGCA